MYIIMLINVYKKKKDKEPNYWVSLRSTTKNPRTTADELQAWNLLVRLEWKNLNKCFEEDN
jgi:hypothetical protein